MTWIPTGSDAVIANSNPTRLRIRSQGENQTSLDDHLVLPTVRQTQKLTMKMAHSSSQVRSLARDPAHHRHCHKEKLKIKGSLRQTSAQRHAVVGTGLTKLSARRRHRYKQQSMTVKTTDSQWHWRQTWTQRHTGASCGPTVPPPHQRNCLTWKMMTTGSQRDSHQPSMRRRVG
ncbi:hypothetical protein V1264_008081 [Littorina saxatilis]|uniref:Uncharacterized protein n=1 Tax=Littorina saxatilis TaxID=31220 RepID=A0AAN9ASD2_9CAEN